MSLTRETVTADSFNASAADYLPGLIGVRFKSVALGRTEAELEIRKALMAPNGYLHAGTVVSFADTAAGCGCVRSLPEGAAGFTTIELKANFIGTAREGWLDCRAVATHLGRTTQLWDAEVAHRDSGKTIAFFRCTQMILWPK